MLSRQVVRNTLAPSPESAFIGVHRRFLGPATFADYLDRFGASTLLRQRQAAKELLRWTAKAPRPPGTMGEAFGGSVVRWFGGSRT